MSIIRPPLGLRPGHLLIAAAVLASAALAGPVEAAPQGPHRLVFRVTAHERQDVLERGAVNVVARCPTEACLVVASLSSRHPALRTARVRAKLRRGHPEHLTLPLRSRQRARLEAAFAAGHAPTIIVHAVAHDANDTTVPVNLKVHPRKP